MDYQQMVKERNEKNYFAKENGIRLDEIAEGYAKTSMEVSQRHLNPIGSVHGGCLYTIADVTAGAAAFSYGAPAATVNSDMHYLRAGLNTTAVYGEAHVLKRGKRTIVLETSIYDQDHNLLATGIFTYMVINA